VRFDDERYVRLYTRETPEWTLLPWQSRLVWNELLKRFDRAGILELGKSKWKGIASVCRLPLDLVEAAMPELLTNGCCALLSDGKDGEVLFASNFIEAQEARQSDKARARAAREKAADRKRAVQIGLIFEEHGDSPGAFVTFRDGSVTKRDGGVRGPSGSTEAPPSAGPPEARGGPDTVTRRDGSVTKRDGGVRPRTEPSHQVTPRHSVLSRAEPCRTVPPARTPDAHAPAPLPGQDGIPAGAEPGLFPGSSKETRQIFAELSKYPAAFRGVDLPQLANAIEGERMAAGRDIVQLLANISQAAAEVEALRAGGEVVTPGDAASMARRFASRVDWKAKDRARASGASGASGASTGATNWKQGTWEVGKPVDLSVYDEKKSET